MSAWSIRSYAVRRAIQAIARQPAVFVLSVLLATLGVLLVLATAIAVGAARPLAAQIDLGPQAAVFALIGASAQEVKTLQTRVAALPAVADVKTILRDDALAELARRSGSQGVLADLKNNPLPDTLLVRFASRADPALVESTVAAMRKLPRVDAVQFDGSWYRKLDALLRVLLLAAGGSAIAGGLLVVLLLLGAVRLQVSAAAAEIRVLTAVGADRRFIVRPFAYLGALTLLLAGLLALCTAWGALALLNPLLGDLGKLYGTSLALGLPAPIWLAAAALGGVLAGGGVASIAARASVRTVEP